MKKMIILFLILLGIISFTGCSTGPGQPEIRQISNTTQKQIVIKLNFPKKDTITNNTISINKKVLLKEIKNAIVKYSKYTEFGPANLDPVITKYVGVMIKINEKQNYIEIVYANGEFNVVWYLNKVIFKIPYTINNKYITFNYPKNFTYIPCNDAVGLTINPLDKNFNNLKTDVFNILNKLPQTKLYISKTFHLKGEINTPYNSDSIYANFKRLLGEYKGDYWYGNKIISPIEKKNYFALKIRNKIYPLKIEVYPYRNKSKIIYETYISYKIYSDGTVQPNLTEMKKIKRKIKDIINN